MRTKVIMTICLFLLMVGKASAQWSVIDPTNIAQSIINSSNNIVHTSSTAQNMINNFKETVKIYEQGKKYYDALKSVNNLVKDARKVQQTILMVGDITDIYINNYQKMMHDDNFSVEELSAIGFGYTKLLEESNDVLTELKNVVNITTLSMTDKGANGRGGTLLLEDEALPQSRELLHQQEHFRELSACQEEKRPRPHHGTLRQVKREILVAYGFRESSPDTAFPV